MTHEAIAVDTLRLMLGFWTLNKSFIKEFWCWNPQNAVLTLYALTSSPDRPEITAEVLGGEAG